SGRVPGLLTLAGDILKGSIPPLLAIKLNGDPITASLAGFSAFFGHLFPLFLNFRGGKGVATACGVFLAISPVSLILSLPVFVLLLLTTGYVSVGSIGAALAMPLYLYFLGMGPVYTVLGVVIGVLIIYTHRDNIKRIIKGEEIPFRASLSKDYRK
ncbi:MAG TPA: glycerol-3-phosphate acyltransferase, partial [Thermodesulfobacteriota bacterium]|nr:glycerol-3-phosphate acyltransferase [Thermodesulfobacteriota bacterium]